MRFWIRELAGWLLIVLGLFVFYSVYAVLMSPVVPAPRLLESGPLAFIGFVIFRGGIHLLKVAMAARICLYAQREIARRQTPATTAVREGPRRTGLPLDW